VVLGGLKVVHFQQTFSANFDWKKSDFSASHMSKTVKVFLIFQQSFSAKHWGGIQLSGAECLKTCPFKFQPTDKNQSYFYYHVLVM
jgi:hypothetical protein